ncbi:MAG: hypothetical protein V4663_18755 [Bacteroidota bacterium]
MLQNRVNPFGALICTPARGVWLGNRGQLHGKGKVILRPFKHTAWIICVLEFKGRKREIMSPNLWTELFFLDEATALAAGHRPCFECRREDANRFKRAWIKGNPQYNFDLKTPISKIDEVLQSERIDAAHKKVTYTSLVKDLPDGTFIAIANEAYLLVNQHTHLWTPFGYSEVKQIEPSTMVTVLTPKSIVNALKVEKDLPSGMPFFSNQI